MCHTSCTTARIASSCAAGVPRAEPASRLRSLTFPQPDGCFPGGGASLGTAHCDLIVGCPPMAIAASLVMRSAPLARCRGGCHDDAPQREANLTTGPDVIAGRSASRWLAPGAASASPVALSEERCFRPRDPKTSSLSAIFPPRGCPTDSEEPVDLTSLASRPLPLSRTVHPKMGVMGQLDCRALLRRRVRCDPSHC